MPDPDWLFYLTDQRPVVSDEVLEELCPLKKRGRDEPYPSSENRSRVHELGGFGTSAKPVRPSKLLYVKLSDVQSAP